MPNIQAIIIHTRQLVSMISCNASLYDSVPILRYYLNATIIALVLGFLMYITG
jgi:hypothetical protein